jgi:cephalosporin hydroxylase
MNLEKFKHSCRKRVRNFYNAFFKKPTQYLPSDLPALNEIKERALKRTAINEHLVTLFIESVTMKPRLIVELGVGGGATGFALSQVAKLCGSRLVSLDINDRSHVNSYEDWIFIQADDIEFAKGFSSWCKQRQIPSQIDVLLIDTSHLYDHTVQEIAAYFPLLADHAKVFFHDTNLKEIYFRKDGTMDLGWDNNRGVIRAVEDFFHKSFNEKQEFVDYCNSWIIKHYPYSCGFTILERLPLPVEKAQPESQI